MPVDVGTPELIHSMFSFFPRLLAGIRFFLSNVIQNTSFIITEKNYLPFLNRTKVLRKFFSWQYVGVLRLLVNIKFFESGLGETFVL
jgi:hypothetical protein